MTGGKASAKMLDKHTKNTAFSFPFLSLYKSQLRFLAKTTFSGSGLPTSFQRFIQTTNQFCFTIPVASWTCLAVVFSVKMDYITPNKRIEVGENAKPMSPGLTFLT